ncbi:hypothetical protein [Pontibacter liquoris]|uniref:hypothetical protein n=1 Tax=Pontibacter liquoris TaxID=2905677 RepID=UPI001FA79AEA|nr:hypothetical protein [Pontibacter liquoris]
MERYCKGILSVATLALTMGLVSCGGNNGDMPSEDNYKNTTESAPESTDNLTGYGDITDSTGTDTAKTGTTAGSTTTSGTGGMTTSGGTTSGGTTSGTTTSATTAGSTTSGTTGSTTTGGGTTGN